MNIEYNSQELFYKEPFGAVPCGSDVRFRLSLSGVGIPWEVKLICGYDGEEDAEYDMNYVFCISDISVYEVTVPFKKSGLAEYYFKVAYESGAVYYTNNKECLGGVGEIAFLKPEIFYQLTVYDRDYKTPDWFKTAVAYQIFPDRFYNGNEDGSFLGNRSDIIKRNPGDTPFYKPEQFGGEYLANDFFGGNIPGIIKKIPYLKELGVTVIYLNPIFRAYSNHKYDTGNYKEIDPMFGTEEDFVRLCREARRAGIRIILDGVFNHTGSNSLYFNKDGQYDSIGAYQSKDSKYYDWYMFENYPDEYECWWGMKTLPHINEKSESLQEYLLTDKDSVVKRWLRLGASGWRLDVVDELPGFFTKKLRTAAKDEKSDCVIIGEVWEDASNKVSYGERREYFQGKELDSVMNYPLRDVLIKAVLGKISADELNRRIMSLKENYPAQSFYSLLNILSSHDVERILTMMGDVPSMHETTKDFQAAFRLGDKYGAACRKLKQIAGMQMTLPGVPCIYYGDELGTEGYADPFCRSYMDFSKASDDNDIYNEYKKLIALRKSSDAFTVGEFECVYKIGRIYGYMRRYRDELYVVLSSFEEHDESIRLDLGRFSAYRIKNLYCDEEMISRTGIYFVDINAHENKYFKVLSE